MLFGVEIVKGWDYSLVQLVSNIFNLGEHDPPTSQTDGDRRTERRTTCDSNTAHCTNTASRGKKGTSLASIVCCQPVIWPSVWVALSYQPLGLT